MVNQIKQYLCTSGRYMGNGSGGIQSSFLAVGGISG